MRGLLFILLISLSWTSVFDTNWGPCTLEIYGGKIENIDAVKNIILEHYFSYKCNIDNCVSLTRCFRDRKDNNNNNNSIKSVYNNMEKPAFIFDGRKILDQKMLLDIGFKAYEIGKPNTN